MRLGAMLATGVLIVLATAGPAAAAAPDPFAVYNQVVVAVGGRAVEPQTGGYCLQIDPPTTGPYAGVGGICADVAYDPHPTPVVRAARRASLLACAAAPARRIRFAVMRDSHDGAQELAAPRARRVDATGRCWTARLPRPVRKAEWLEVGVDYGRHGVAHFLVGLRPRR